MSGIIRVLDVWVHLIGSSDKDLLAFDVKLRMTSDRFSLYRLFKTLAGVEPYIMLNLNRYLRYALTRFRSGVSDINLNFIVRMNWNVNCVFRLRIIKSQSFEVVLHSAPSQRTKPAHVESVFWPGRLTVCRMISHFLSAWVLLSRGCCW